MIEQTTLFEIEHLNVKIKNKNILRDISLRIPQNEFTAIIGPNGVGKSTLLKCLNRLKSATYTKLNFLNRPLNDYAIRELATLQTYVPQGLTTVPSYTIEEFIQLSQYPHQSPLTLKHQPQLQQKIMEAIDLMNILDSKQYLTTLSGGELQKVLLASSYVQQADTWFLDEPTTYLDPFYQQQIHQILSNLHHQGKNILMVTHDINAALAYATSIIALKNGEIAFHGSVENFIQTNQIHQLYDKTFVQIQQDSRTYYI